MKLIRVSEIPDKHNMYHIWFDLDARNETMFTVDTHTGIKTIIDMINDIQERYKKGQFKV